MRLCAAVCVLVLAGMGLRVSAQEPSAMQETPEDAQVQQWLESGEARSVAWGAHAVLAQRRTELLPKVEATAERWETLFAARPSLWDRDRFYAMLSVLDTVIQMDGTLPAETLVKLDASLATQRIVLLKRLPWDEAAPVWQEMYWRDETQQMGFTRVAAEMLAEHPTTGFAADVLKRITVAARVQVTSPGSGTGLGGGGGSGTSCCGGSGPPRREDWPEVGTYALQDTNKHRGAVLLLEGPPAVYLIREVSHRFYPELCGGFSGLTDAMRVQLLGRMLGEVPAETVIDLQPEVDIVFQDREAYRAQVVRFVEAQQARFKRVTTGLEERGFLAAEERQSAALPMRLTLVDLRGPEAVDLPAIAFRPPVEWAAP